MKKIILAAFLSTAMVPAAFAQATTAPATSTTPMQSGTTATGTMAPAAGTEAAVTPATPSMDGPFVTVAEAGIQRVSDIQGQDVYSRAGEDIGEVNDVLIGPDGRVAAVVVGVGGFLGIGAKNVAVSMDSLQLPTLTDDDVTASTTADTTAMAPATTTTGTAMAPAATGTAMAPAATGTAMAPATGTATTQVASAETMATRIVLDVTREQLEQAPAYEGNVREVAQ